MSAFKFSGIVTSVRDLTHNVKEFVFQVSDHAPFHFKAGQFIFLDIDRVMRRPYSVASAPQDLPKVTLCIKQNENDPSSSYFSGLKVGDTLTFSGPHGSFIFQESAGEILFVATGTGVSPIRSLLLHLFSREPSVVSTLYFGIRSEQDFLYRKEFEDFSKRYPNFHFIPTLSDPSQDWKGLRGRVTNSIEREFDIHRFSHIYLCGNSGMVQEAREILKKKNFESHKIHFERFY